MKKLIIIGDPIEHSLSPIMHNAALKELNLDKEWTYTKLRVKSIELANLVKKMRDDEITGINVTIPHKINIIQHLDGLTKEAQLIVAVNTITKENGRITGHNTDGIGCLQALVESNVNIDGKIIILGAGGAARAIVFALAMNGAREIIIFNRTAEKAKLLANEVTQKTNAIVRAENLENIKKELIDADILINCTSIGMKGEQENKTLVTTSDLHPNLIVMDIIYNPLNTRLLEEAKNAGCKTINGINMLVNQGAAALEIWTGKKAPTEIMKRVLLNELTNIVLIGFRGTGKTSVGKALAKKLSKTLVETDEIIERKANKSVSKIFIDDGQITFRELEIECIKNIFRTQNAIISCGGGVVLNKINIDRLRKNGTIILLTASIEMINKRIAGSNRPPLEASNEDLLKFREPFYNSAADLIIDTTNLSVEEVADIIVEKMNL